MDAVSYAFYGHVVNEVDALDCTFVLVSHLVVEARHGVVEVRDVGEACFEGGFHVIVFCVGVCDTWQDSLFCTVTSELQGSWKFWSGIPTRETFRLFHDGDVFVGVWVLYPFRLLCPCLCGVEVVSFEVKTEDGRVLFLHEFGTSMYCLLNHRHSTAAQGREDSGRAMFRVSFHSSLECFRCAFLEVSATTSVNVHIDESGHDIHAFCVDEVSSDDGQIAVCHLEYLVVSKDDAAVLEPSLRGQDFCINDLG